MGSEVRTVCCQWPQRNHQWLVLHIPMEMRAPPHSQGPCSAACCYSNRQDVTLLCNTLYFLFFIFVVLMLFVVFFLNMSRPCGSSSLSEVTSGHRKMWIRKTCTFKMSQNEESPAVFRGYLLNLIGIKRLCFQCCLSYIPLWFWCRQNFLTKQI